MLKICSRVTDTTADADNKSSTEQESFRNKGKNVRRKNEHLLLRKKELRNASLIHVHIWSQKIVLRATQCTASIVSRHCYILPCCEAGAIFLLFLSWALLKAPLRPHDQLHRPQLSQRCGRRTAIR